MKLIVLALSMALTGLAQNRVAQKVAPKSPKLVVFIAVDQFRYDYLLRFRKDYNSGLARLLESGAVFTNANYQHYPTVTAVGHSTMLSGATPNVSGIVANDWWDRATGKEVTSVEEFNPQIKNLGSDSKKVASPHRLLVSTLGDEIKMSGQWDSKVIGISIKDRSAILPSGRMANGAYWFDIDSGNWVSSSWYFKTLPDWVTQLNKARAADKFAGAQWKPLLETGPAFKQMPATKDKKLYTELESSPYGNELIEDLVEAAIVQEKLGQRGGLDLLTISYSANDYVGHKVGPDDPQVRDMAIRTDRLLGRLFSFLDGKVGRNNYIVGFTSDHGVPALPATQRARKMPGARIDPEVVRNAINNRLSKLYGGGTWVLNKNPEGPYLNEGLGSSRKVNMTEARNQAADAVRQLPGIMRVYTREQIVEGRLVVDKIGQRVTNGYFMERSPDLIIVPEPYLFFKKEETGTTHASPFGYDTHVPLILMGTPFKAGNYHSSVAVNDMAPTLATVLGVEIPSGSVGRILAEALVN